ncbi:site-specific integrase [Endozoicomonas euniceicola]|uniref:Tyrosine-type recombinase/integrase n=1 Tax=Endozoicomonas euniceicola TaxID=1234143 RepID=A0ABY6GW63_9GAMM|nr:tyrosine-type recombinase/integrase [Endozoicomonas euniceicola]UYM16321.1 tyrosine-type recombinase/integrase [Endozoicomonas euniceicola]
MPKSRTIRRFKETGTKKAPALSPKELKRLLYVAGETRNPERNQLIVWMLFAAGFRITEVAQIEVQDVISVCGDIKAEVIIPAKYSKSGRAGRVYFYHPKLTKALDRYLNYRVSNKLMLDIRGSNKYLGLRKCSKLILSENKRPYYLKRKTRTKKDGSVAMFH